MRVLHRWGWLALAGLVLVGASCGGDERNTGGLTAETYAARLAEAECAFAFRCCDLTERAVFAGGASTEAECATVMDARTLKLDVILAARAETGNVTFDAARAADVIAGVRDFPCGGGKPLVEMLYKFPFDGTLSDGEPCITSFECMRPSASGRANCVGDVPGTGGPGFCEVTLRPVSGEPCTDFCADGLTCDLTTNRCVTRVSLAAEGAPCAVNDDCASKECDSSSLPGVCLPAFCTGAPAP